MNRDPATRRKFIPGRRPARRGIVLGALALLASGSLRAQAHRQPPGVAPATAPLRPAAPGVTGEAIFQALIEHNHARDRQLGRYLETRTYSIGNLKGKVYAREIVQVRYRAPSTKLFHREAAHGSWLARHLVLNRLIASEKQTSSGRRHRDSSITPRNYAFRLLGEQRLGTIACYVVEAKPRHKGKYLFTGKIWISQSDFAIVRIAGHPVKKLSFWVERVHFVRQYEQIGPFWLPQTDSTLAKIRFAGWKTLTIEYHVESINGQPSAPGAAAVAAGSPDAPRAFVRRPPAAGASAARLTAARRDGRQR